MTEEEIKQYAHEYAKKIIVFDSEFSSDKFRDIKQAFIEGADFMYYSNNEELKKQLTEKDKQIEELEKEKVAREIIDRELLKKNDELEAQIEKMKRCEICKHYRWNHCSYETNISKDCIQNKLKHFELKE